MDRWGQNRASLSDLHEHELDVISLPYGSWMNINCNGLYMDGVFGNLEIKNVRDRLLFLEKSSAFDDIL